MSEPNKFFEETKKIKTEVKKQVVGYILAAFGLVAGLAWNDAIKALIQHFFPGDKSSIPAQFVYALVITIVVVVIGIYLARLAADVAEKKEQK